MARNQVRYFTSSHGVLQMSLSAMDYWISGLAMLPMGIAMGYE